MLIYEGALLLLLLSWSEDALGSDPAPTLYPGQVNIGLLTSLHSPEGGRAGRAAVRRAMAAVWAAHQANFDREDPRALTRGVYIYDTWGREDVAERQAYRLVGHVMNEETPPLFAVITDMPSFRAPIQLLRAFSVPVISTTETPDIFSSAPATRALARGAVSVLHQLGLLQVGVVAEEDDLFAHFSAQAAHVTGMQATHWQDGPAMEDVDTLAAIKLISAKSRLQAVVFLVSCEEALSVLNNMTDSLSIPWLVVTPSDISTQLSPRLLTKVLLLSPESQDVPAFDDYFQQLLKEDTIKYHPLLREYLESSDTTAHGSGVSSVVRAVHSLSAALASVERGCRDQDCLKTGLSSRVNQALSGFDSEGTMGSIRYVLKGIRRREIKQLGFYSDDEGLNFEADVFSFIEDPSKWQIFDQDNSTHEILVNDLLQDSKFTLQDDDDLQSLSSNSSSKDEKRPSSNLRFISIKSNPQTDRHGSESWLGKPYSLAVLGTSAILSLCSLYALVYLLVKSCEEQRPGSWLAGLQLLALLVLCAGAALHAWKPAPLVCGLRRVVGNVGLVFCYGGLLLKGMSLRSSSLVGLGGRVSRTNQLLTLCFVVGGQVALESQWPLDCSAPKLASQAYAALALLIALGVAFATRRLPYSRAESRSLIFTSLACLVVFLCWLSACWLLAGSAGQPVFLLATSLTVLLGTCVPQMVAPPPHKPLSDSLSTLFHKDTISCASSTATGRGRKKTLENLYADYQSAYP